MFEALRSRWRPAPTQDEAGPPTERKLLVVSDMHLGRDPRPITGFSGSTRPTPEFDDDFIALVAHYTAGQESAWRIILDGDFFDFVEVVVRPGHDTPLRLSFQVTDEEREIGLGTEPERAKVKLDMIVEYHHDLFETLARFVRAGGELVMIRGNHDQEMFWGKVQRVLRQRMAEMAFRGERYSVDELLDLRSNFQSRISLVPWCYVEPGRVYIEHGHQYDPYCSFDHQLYPVSPTNPRSIDTPLFMFTMRYFVNRMSDFAAHYADYWTARDYARWLSQKGPGGAIYTLRMGLEAALRVIRYAALFWLGRVRLYEHEHERRLGQEAERYGVDVEALRRIDALHYTPVNRNLPELMRLLFLDRFLLGAGTFTLILLWLVVFENAWVEMVGVLGSIAAGYALNRLLVPRRFLLPGPRQAYAAREIADLLGVQIVVMGHSHQRRKVDLDDGRYYVNTGCWLPSFDTPVHERDDTCTCNLSHLVIADRHADLKVFCRVHKKPRMDQPPATASMPRSGSGTIDLPPPEPPVASVSAKT